VWVVEAHAFKEARMPHHEARFITHGREVVVRRVVDDGETFAQSAASANVAKSTAWEWVGR
jgi:hypothetical protein